MEGYPPEGRGEVARGEGDVHREQGCRAGGGGWRWPAEGVAEKGEAAG